LFRIVNAGSCLSLGNPCLGFALAVGNTNPQGIADSLAPAVGELDDLLAGSKKRKLGANDVSHCAEDRILGTRHYAFRPFFAAGP